MRQTRVTVREAPRGGDSPASLRLTSRGARLIVTLNGVQTVNIQDGKHASGAFALQYGAGVRGAREPVSVTSAD